jgi:adenine-specific DNA-methyltransferase
MPEPTRYGPDNPHPLSQMKTELIWAGKYDAAGRKVAPVRVKLPFQTVETVNESSQQRQFARSTCSAQAAKPNGAIG